MAWEIAGEEYGVVTHAYSFSGHVQYGKNPVILSNAELDEGFEHVQVASTTLKRPVTHIPNYTRNLLSRNWFQVKNADAIFAIGMIDSPTMVRGGTGWAVQMALDNNKPVHVYDQKANSWAMYDYEWKMFVHHEETPVLTENFAGIGTREITDAGVEAISHIYEITFNRAGLW